MIKLNILFISLLVGSLACQPPNRPTNNSEEQIDLKPYPHRVLQREGNFIFNREVRLAADFSNQDLNLLVSGCVEQLLDRIGHRLKIQDIYRSDTDFKTIEFVLSEDADLENAAYEVLVVSEKITLKARNIESLKNAWQSCLQLISNSWNNGQSTIQSMRIIDQPRYTWRGVTIGDSTKLEQLIEKCIQLKINLLVLTKEQSEVQTEMLFEYLRKNSTADLNVGVMVQSSSNATNGTIRLLGFPSKVRDLETFLTYEMYSPDAEYTSIKIFDRCIVSETENLNTRLEWNTFADAAW